MSDEDRKFFGGMLLGAIIVGVIIITLLIFITFQNAPEAGQYRVPVKKIEQEMEELHYQTVSHSHPDKVGERTVIGGQKYVILKYMHNHANDQVLRVVIPDIEENGKLIQELKANGAETACFDNSSLTAAGVTHDIQGPVTFSLWGRGGEELRHFDNEVTAKLAPNPSYCILAERWFADNAFVLTATWGDAGFSGRQAYIYTPQDGSLEETLAYSSESLILEPNDEGQSVFHIFHSWSYGDMLMQQLEESVGDENPEKRYSPLYFGSMSDSGENFDSVADQAKIAYDTSDAVTSNIISEYNLTHYKKGIEFAQRGDKFVVLWKKNINGI